MAADDTTELLRRIDRTLNALLAIVVDQHLRTAEGSSKARPRSVDKLLSDSGLTGVEIARILGKTPQAVSNALAREAKRKQSGMKTGMVSGIEIQGEEVIICPYIKT